MIKIRARTYKLKLINKSFVITQVCNIAHLEFAIATRNCESVSHLVIFTQILNHHVHDPRSFRLRIRRAWFINELMGRQVGLWQASAVIDPGALGRKRCNVIS